MSDDIKDEEIDALLVKNPMTSSGEYQKMNIRLLRAICKGLNPSTPEKPAQVERPEQVAKPEPKTKRKKLRG